MAGLFEQAVSSVRQHFIQFDDSNLVAVLGYLRNSSDENLKRLVLKPGSKMGHAHHAWSSLDPPKDERKDLRLWYITGCYMAQKIEEKRGTEELKALVKKGSAEFFETYSESTKNRDPNHEPVKSLN